MPKPAKGARLASGPDHEKLLLGGLAAALIRDERIRTTEAKAKRLRPVAERLITLGKDGSVHARRQALQVVEDREVIHKLFAEVAPRYEDRNGGYTRILKLGPRKGDAAPMALIELIEGEAEIKVPAEGAEGRRQRVGRKRRKESAAAPSAEQAEEPEAAQVAEEPEAAQVAEEPEAAMDEATNVAREPVEQETMEPATEPDEKEE